MITAEQWYEYQGNYSKYGFDMKPQVAVPKREVVRTTVIDRRKLIFFILVVGCLFIATIVASAYAASIAYSNNELKTGINMLQGEVDALSIDIESASNVQNIEKRAIEELGMVYPRDDQYVQISGQEAPGSDFALLLKAEAFN
jgi:cell division protein FtsL